MQRLASLALALLACAGLSALLALIPPAADHVTEAPPIAHACPVRDCPVCRASGEMNAAERARRAALTRDDR